MSKPNFERDKILDIEKIKNVFITEYSEDFRSRWYKEEGKDTAGGIESAIQLKQNCVNNYCNGNFPEGVLILMALAKRYKMTIDEFLYGKKEKEDPDIRDILKYLMIQSYKYKIKEKGLLDLSILDKDTILINGISFDYDEENQETIIKIKTADRKSVSPSYKDHLQELIDRYHSLLEFSDVFDEESMIDHITQIVMNNKSKYRIKDEREDINRDTNEPA